MNKENGLVVSTDTASQCRTRTGRSEPNTACDTIECRNMTATDWPVTTVAPASLFAPRTKTSHVVVLAAVLLGAFASGARAQIAVSANDGGHALRTPKVRLTRSLLLYGIRISLTAVYRTGWVQ